MTQPKEQRRVAFELPAEVFEGLLEEIEMSPELNFWENLRTYYKLSPIQGDTVIASSDFIEFISVNMGGDRPPWVYEQSSLKKMQCMVVAGRFRGVELLAILKEIDQKRDEGEREERGRGKQIEELFQEKEWEKDEYNDNNDDYNDEFSL